MAANRLTDDLNQRITGDDDVDKTPVVKREIVEENKQGKRKSCMDTTKDKRSQTNNKNKLSRSKSNQGTPNSTGKTKLVGQVKSPAMVRAENFQLSLGTKSPSFVKLLVKSNVDGSFSVTLPASFSRSHLPMDETMITFEDESEEKFEVKYIPKWTGLSGGWRKFALSHQLRERDVLVFHLVEPTKFKVYIIRANDWAEGDVNPNAHAKQNERGENVGSDDIDNTPIATLKTKKMKPLQSIIQKKNKRVLLEHEIDQSENDNKNLSSESSGRSNSPEPNDPCKGLETFRDFQIRVNGLCVESELDENMLKKYYELCHCKNAILHDQVFSGLNAKLVAGIISETVNIADAIKACNFTTSREELEQWENSLKSFKLLGMNVGFLLNRVSQLLKLGVGHEGTRFEDEIKKLEVKRIELKEAYEKRGVDIEKLKSKAEKLQLKFQQVVNSPW